MFQTNYKWQHKNYVYFVQKASKSRKIQNLNVNSNELTADVL